MEEYVVEAILDEKRVKRGARSVVKYKVKWEGYEAPTWEPLANLRNCKDKLDAYRAAKSRPTNTATVVMEAQEASTAQGRNETSPDMPVGVVQGRNERCPMDMSVGVGAENEASSAIGYPSASGSKNHEVEEHEESDYEVQEIVGEKRFRQANGEYILKYHVKWCGYKELTWEPLDNLKNCVDKVEAFKAGVSQENAVEESKSETENNNEDDNDVFDFNDDDNYEDYDEEESAGDRSSDDEPMRDGGSKRLVHGKSKQAPRERLTKSTDDSLQVSLDSEEEGSGNDDLIDDESDEETETIVEIGEMNHYRTRRMSLSVPTSTKTSQRMHCAKLGRWDSSTRTMETTEQGVTKRMTCAQKNQGLAQKHKRLPSR